MVAERSSITVRPNESQRGVPVSKNRRHTFEVEFIDCPGGHINDSSAIAEV